MATDRQALSDRGDGDDLDVPVLNVPREVRRREYVPRESFDRLRAENERYREALAEIASGSMFSQKIAKTALAVDDEGRSE